MNPSAKWLLWVLALFALAIVVDIVTFAVGAGFANAQAVRQAGQVVIGLLAAYLVAGLLATALVWWTGRHVGAGARTVGTIAFLLVQGLVFAFMSMATLLGTNR